MSSPTPTPTAPPIAQLLPLLRSASEAALSAITLFFNFFYSFSGIFLKPLDVFLPLAAALFAPITVICSIIIDAFVLTPYALVSSVLAFVYPLYVFFGIACISGIVIGVIGRALIYLLFKALASLQHPASRVPSSPTLPASPVLISPPEIQPPIVKLRRRRSSLRVKIEDD